MIPWAKKFNSGFSLIELMVVLSILSAIVSLSIPSYISLKIQAAQIEAKQNLNLLYTMAKSYQSELGSLPYGSYGYSIFSPTTSWSCTPNGTSMLSNTTGFKVSDCSKLRYYYSFNARKATFGSIISYGPTNVNGDDFSITAQSEAFNYGSGSGVTYGYGSIPIPGKLCRSLTTYNYHYADMWIMTENRELRPMYTATRTYNAVKDCFQ